MSPEPNNASWSAIFGIQEPTLPERQYTYYTLIITATLFKSAADLIIDTVTQYL